MHSCRLVHQLKRRAVTLSRRYKHDKAKQFGDCPSSVEILWQNYRNAKTAQLAAVPDLSLNNPKAVFANNELNLSEIGAYGFDYDYTLAIYTKAVNLLIYESALEKMITDWKYPAAIADLPYDPTFAVRGLHYDISKGVLLKLDAFCQVQLGTVYRGYQPLTDDEVRALYGGTSIPRQYVEPEHLSTKGGEMKQLLDLFSLPELGLLASVTNYFIQHNIEYDPRSLFEDVTDAVNYVHVSGILYKAVMNDVERYIHLSPGMRIFLQRLRNNGKNIFLVTNSPFSFVNRGMEYLVGADWRDFFNYIVVRARKPTFFTEHTRPFRVYNEETDRLSWSKVEKLHPNTIYAGGNLTTFAKRTELSSKGVLYFGDHMFADLAMPMLRYGWRTGAIVPELEREVKIGNSTEFREAVSWLTALTNLIESNQLLRDSEDPGERETIEAWLRERFELRRTLKIFFNRQFGSIFRTYHNPTYFSKRLQRLSDIYTSSLPNLLNYSLQHTFYPRRMALPHETTFIGRV